MSRGLTKKQLAVLDDLFAGNGDEDAVLGRRKVSRKVYNRWLADERFVAEFDRRIASAQRQGRVLVARYATLAAAKLVELCDSEKEETRRRACLDILSMQKEEIYQQDSMEKANEPDEHYELSEETASRILQELAKEK